MNAPLLARSRRTRRTPFTDRVTAAGVKAYTVYNHMLLPAVFRSVEEDCHHLKTAVQHLKTAVQLWDVACERQIALSGPEGKPAGQIGHLIARSQKQYCNCDDRGGAWGRRHDAGGRNRLASVTFRCGQWRASRMRKSESHARKGLPRKLALHQEDQGGGQAP